MKNEIVLYQSGELAEHIEVRLDEETVWLTGTNGYTFWTVKAKY